MKRALKIVAILLAILGAMFLVSSMSIEAAVGIFLVLWSNNLMHKAEDHT